ncbi:MAG: hypothetical protein J7527_01730 [Chitinophagaceae bacterium]|nr:hypothetical protein [Chitinophagaceae bacterium]
MKQWTLKDIQRLHKDGKIKAFKENKPGPKPIKNDRSKEKIWLDLNLRVWGLERGLAMVTEHRFHPERKWRFDWCFPDSDVMIAVEYEGIFGKGKSRHTTVNGYTGDTEKYNSASALGWKVFRVTAKNYKTIIQTLNDTVQ